MKQIYGTIHSKILKFLREGITAILHVTITQGGGKTFTTLKTISNEGYKFIYIGRTHELVKNKLNELNLVDVKPIEGMKRLCIKENEYKQAMKWNVNPKQLLCERCGIKCAYKKQFIGIEDISWAGVHQHIPLINQMINKDGLDYDVLIIDEDFIDAVSSETAFNSTQLIKLDKMLYETISNIDIFNKKGEVKNSYNHIYFHYLTLKDIIRALLRILTYVDTNDSNTINGTDFIALLCNHIETDAIMDGAEYARLYLRERYYDLLYQKLNISDDEFKDFRNIFDDVVAVLDLYKKYRHNNKKIAIPIGVISYPKKKNEIWLNTLNTELPNIPIIWLDANGDTEFAKHVFTRPIEEFNIDIDVKHNIIQIMDGNYSLRSMGEDGTRNRCWHFILLNVNEWIENGAKKVWIITHMRYSKVEYEKHEPEDKPPVDTRGKSLEHYLKKHGVDMSKIGITYHQRAIGIELEGLDGKLIVHAVPEPPFKIYVNKASMYFEGQEPLSNERIVEPKGSKRYGHDYRCKDKRYNSAVKRVRENQLEHNVGRLRTIINLYSECILMVNLPLNINTKQMTMKEYIKMKGWDKETGNIKVLKLIVNKGILGRNELIHTIRRWSPVQEVSTDETKGYQIVIDRLVSNGMIRSSMIEQKTRPKEYFQATEKGRDYVKNL